MGKGTKDGWGCCLFRCLQISHFEIPMGIVPSAYTMSFPYRNRPAVWQGLHSMLIQRAHCPLPEHPCGALAVHPQPLGLETNHQPPVRQGLHSMLIQRARCPLPEHPCGALAVHPEPLRLEARRRHVFLDYLLSEVSPSHTLEVIPAAFAQATNTVVHLPLPHTTCPALPCPDLPCLSGCPVSSLSTAASSVYLRFSQPSFCPTRPFPSPLPSTRPLHPSQHSPLLQLLSVFACSSAELRGSSRGHGHRGHHSRRPHNTKI